MSEQGKRYRELLDEMVWQRVQGKLTREIEIRLAAQLDRIWNTLDEAEQSVIELELVEADRKSAKKNEWLCNDSPEGSGHSLRSRVAR